MVFAPVPANQTCCRSNRMCGIASSSAVLSPMTYQRPFRNRLARFLRALASRLHQPRAPGVDGGLGAVRQVQLAQDVADVVLDCVLADDQLLGDGGVAAAIRDEPQHPLLALA